MLDVTNFTSELRMHGTHPTNRFLVNITLPDFNKKPPATSPTGSTPPRGLFGKISNTIGDIVSDLSVLTSDRQLSLRATQAIMPGRTIMTKDDLRRFGYGAVEKVGYGSLFQNVPVAFIVDSKQQIVKVFDKWMDLISLSQWNSDEANRYLAAYKDDYATQVTITEYNRKNQQTRKCTLYEAFPVNKQDTQLSWDQNDQIKILPITFTYTDYKME